MSRCRRSQSSSAVTFVSTAGQLVVGVDRVPDVVFALLRADDAPVAARVAGEPALVRRLAAAAGVEDRALEEHGVRVGVDLDDARLDLARVGIGVAEVLAHGMKASASLEGSLGLPISLIW